VKGDLVKRSPEKAKDKELAHRKPGHPAHEEWLIDESIEETFPASDPIAPATEPEEKPRKGKRPA
jgi:hypothetical protein